jgi:predicted ester cyclase
MGIPATGRSVQILAVDLAHFRGGRAVERWGGLDVFSLMQQLGVIPDPSNAVS